MTNVHEIGSRVVSALTENGEAHAQFMLQPSGLLLGLGTVPRTPVRVCKCTQDRQRCWAVPVAAGGSLLSTVAFTLQVGIVKEEQLKVHGF